MSRLLGVPVAPLNNNKIDEIARTIRSLFPASEYIDLAALVEENMGSPFVIGEDQEMMNNLGLTDSQGYIWLSEKVYDGLLKGNGHDRFTVAHELGHRVLHKNQIGFARKNLDVVHCRYNDSEVQANRFAGQLLAPKETIIEKNYSIQEISERFGVSTRCAEVAWKIAQKEKDSYVGA